MSVADKALVGIVRKRAASKWGAAWHVLAPEVREAIVKAEALDLIASQVEVEIPMTTFAKAARAAKADARTVKAWRDGVRK